MPLADPAGHFLEPGIERGITLEWLELALLIGWIVVDGESSSGRKRNACQLLERNFNLHSRTRSDIEPANGVVSPKIDHFAKQSGDQGVLEVWFYSASSALFVKCWFVKN